MAASKNKKEKPITKKEKELVDKMLEQLDNSDTLIRNTPKKLSDVQKNHHFDAMKSVLSEYAGPYLILGYGLDESAFVLLNAETTYQQKAVMALLEDVADDLLTPGFPKGMMGQDFD